jgi:outer membrane receptor protein involved in Fe transport
MFKSTPIIMLLLFLISPLCGQALLRGKVMDDRGNVLPGARVTSVESGELLAVTGPGGEFSLERGLVAENLCIDHPGYEFLLIKTGIGLLTQPSLDFEIVLWKKVEFSEEITVSAKYLSPGFAPGSSASTTLEPLDIPEIPTALLDLVQTVPGVSANGQGGLFQVYSIRGVSRHRVTTSILDVRLAGDRRAGVSASFIDPFLFGSVDILKGHPTAYHGSGSLGGVVRITPRKFSGYALDLGCRSEGNEVYSAAGWGNEKWSFGFVGKEAGDSEAPDGSYINSHFTQYSGLLSHSWQLRSGTVELLFMPSLGMDIGKASTDYYKGKVTEYPYEKHVITNLSVRLKSGWDFSGFFHPHSVSTAVNDNGDRSHVDTNSYDSGLIVRKHLQASENAFFILGGDYFSRSGVDSIENRWSFSSPAPSVPFYSLDGASHNEAGLSGDFRQELGTAILEAGMRMAWASQENGEMPAVENTAWSGYGGAAIPVSKAVKLKGSLGTGLRFPSLGELFYGGTTGRGSVEGNPDLVPERAFNLEAGIEWIGPNFIFSTYVFRNSIEDYIERVEVDLMQNPDHLTYRNLTNGKIKGLEWELSLSPQVYLDLFWRGHLMRGTDDKGIPLADIPVHRSTLGSVFNRKKWTAGVNWQYRAGKTNPGSGEKFIDAASLVDFYVQKLITPDLSLRLTGSNLTDEEYYNSADKKVPLSPGRSVAVSLRWNLSGPGIPVPARDNSYVR